MWIVINREARPDAEVWPGRRLLAVTDAVGWPAACAAFVLSAPVSTGAIGQMAVVTALFCGFGRFQRALWQNHRYRFTTWRWGRLIAALMVMGWAMKVVSPA